MPGLVNSGYLFNLNELVAALSVYTTYASTYHSHRLGLSVNPKWNVAQLSYFWCNVVGYLERLVPAVFAQKICSGLKLKNTERTMILHLDDEEKSSKSKYFPLSFDSGHSLGIDIGVFSYSKEAYASSFAAGDNGWDLHDKLSDLVMNVSRSLEELYHTYVSRIELCNLSLKRN